ncbi:MAG: hypothetical protein M5U34_05170 [Chloroflexi bacterium]|nr:hypothetical protein [Chloroflexota bacterium]
MAEWLDFTVTSPGGSSETFRRELFDDIGYEVRAGNGLISDMARDETARLSLMSSWTTLFAAYDVPEEAINDIYQEMVAQTEAGIATREATAGLQDTPNPTPEQNELAKEAIITYGNIARLAQRMHLLKFAAASDQSHDYIGDAFLVKAYPDSPRLFTVGLGAQRPGRDGKHLLRPAAQQNSRHRLSGANRHRHRSFSLLARLVRHGD